MPPSDTALPLLPSQFWPSCIPFWKIVVPTSSMDYTNCHSCQYCERIILSRPEDDPDWHEGSESGRPLLLLKMLRELHCEGSALRRLERAFLFEVDANDLARFVSDGCLFYKFISTGIEKARRESATSDDRSSLQQINSGANQRQARHLILIELEDDHVQISTPDLLKRGDTLFRGPWLLHLCVFGVFTEEGSPAAEKFESIPSINISSEQSFARARNWLDKCALDHPECSRRTNYFTPTRLIKIWTSQGRRLIRLEESGGTEARYAALSYCWGGEQDVRTTIQTFPRHRTRINFQDLPRTIQDAVIVTENLGIRYLWVDALCIIQDDEEDRAQEIGLMGHVYENAEVTIVASRAERVQEGFLQNLLPYGCDMPAWVFKMRYRDLTGKVSPMVIAPISFRTSVDYLSQRAWAFQERLFSYRVLEYGSTCVHWSCQLQSDCDRQGGKCDISRLERGNEIFRGVPDRNAAVTMSTWYKLVDKFSEKSLTIAKDRLPAIGGIAERFGRQPENEYLAGIWRSSLPSGLLWIVDSFKAKSYQPRPSTFLAPSWSWASTIQPIINRVYVGERVSKVDIIKVDIGYQAKGTAYGDVIHGHLTLRGFITPVYWSLPRKTDRYDYGKITRASPSSGHFSIAIDRDAVETSLLAEGINRILAYLLVLTTNKDITEVNGLILHKHSDGKYSRLGVFNIHRCGADGKEYPNMARGFLEGNPEEVTII